MAKLSSYWKTESEYMLMKQFNNVTLTYLGTVLYSVVKGQQVTYWSFQIQTENKPLTLTPWNIQTYVYFRFCCFPTIYYQKLLIKVTLRRG